MARVRRGSAEHEAIERDSPGRSGEGIGMMIANPEKTTVSARSFELGVTSGFDRYSVEHGEWTLSSVFQPVFSLSHMRAVGYEGLLRAHDALDRPVSPLDVFGQASRVGEALQIDRLAQALHLENFKMLGAKDEWLFLNVHPGALTEPYHAAALLANLKRLNLEPRRVVLEVLEQSSRSRCSSFAITVFSSRSTISARATRISSVSGSSIRTSSNSTA
jgi:EAL domain-containing protein (putative c-di-GMP-specific phosphodiesterase class I)